MKTNITRHPYIANNIKRMAESTSYGQKYGFNANEYIAENRKHIDSQFLSLMKHKTTEYPVMTYIEVERVCNAIFDFMLIRTEEKADKLIACIDKNGIPKFLLDAWRIDESDNLELCRKFCGRIRHNGIMFAKLSTIVCNKSIDQWKE